MKPEMNINTQEQCPSCAGTGKISSTLVLEDEIEKNPDLKNRSAKDSRRKTFGSPEHRLHFLFR
jgi:hypothetical protein